MNSTPKQREGDGNVAANGSLSPLEQTVMGIAPAPAGAGGRQPAAALEPASFILPSSVVAPSAAPPPPPAEPAPPAASPPSATLVAAPTIAVVSPADPAPAASASPAAASAREAPASHEAGLGATLRLEPSSPGALPPPRPAEPEIASAEPGVQSEHTALSADYLREARAAALAEVASRPAAPDPIALASTERAPRSEVAAAVENALPITGDTHRSVAPALAPEVAGPRVASGAGPTSARGFEPVPVVRAPLAESLSNALGPLAELGGTRNLLPPSSRPRPPAPPERESGVGRWLLLAAVALVSVGVVSVGGRLWHRYRDAGGGQRGIASVEASAPIPPSREAPAASHALLANRPAPESAGAERVRVVSATAAGSSEPGSSASPESQLAATAGRHVLSGNYADALPIYRQLERSWPENTAYAAMARVLEKKVGSHNDTRTITPAAAP